MARIQSSHTGRVCTYTNVRTSLQENEINFKFKAFQFREHQKNYFYKISYLLGVLYEMLYDAGNSITY